MKKYLFLLITMLCASLAYAQGQPGGGQKNKFQSEKKYRIVVTNMDEKKKEKFKNDLEGAFNTEDRFAPLLLAACKSSIIKKTINAVSNVLTVGVNYLAGLTQQKKKWLEAARARNSFKETLDTYERIEDFYGSRSTKGALDPTDMQFDGFELTSFFQVKNNGKGGKDGKDPGKSKEKGKEKGKKPQDDKGKETTQGDENEMHEGEGNGPMPQEGKGDPGADSPDAQKTDSMGHYAFRLRCKLRTDSLGISHIANHSKFYLTVDTLIIYPEYCDLPHDSTNRDTTRHVPMKGGFFQKRKDLNLEVNVKVYSSWINEAIMIQKDQLLGEFKINALVNEENLTTDKNGDNVFIYTASDSLLGKKLNTQDVVTIEGESFIVPRSYIGTSDGQTWGTGQYRMEFELAEHCEINMGYYGMEAVGNGKDVAGNSANGNSGDQEDRKWKKDLWKQEWNEMKNINPNDSFWRNAWTAIKTAYVGKNSWITEIVDPVVTVLEVETSKGLQSVLKFDAQEFSQETSALQLGGGSHQAGGSGAAGGQQGEDQQDRQQGGGKQGNTQQGGQQGGGQQGNTQQGGQQ